MTDKQDTPKSQVVHIPSLNAAFEEAELSLSKDSPLKAFDRQPGGDANLDSAVDWPEDWDPRQALFCISGQVETAIKTFRQDQISHQFIFPWQANNGHCILSHSSDGNYLAAPISPNGIAAILAEDFDPLLAPPPTGFEFTFSKEEFIAFAAIADFSKYIYAVALLERAQLPVYQFNIDHLWEQAELARANTDYRWLLSFCPDFFPSDKAFASDLLETGCNALIEKGLLYTGDAAEQKAYAASAELILAAAQFAKLEIAASLENKRGEKAAFLYAENLWEIEFLKNSICMKTINGLDLITNIRDILSNGAPAPQSRDLPPEQAVCRNCGANMPPGKNFCTACGQQSADA